MEQTNTVSGDGLVRKSGRNMWDELRRHTFLPLELPRQQNHSRWMQVSLTSYLDVISSWCFWSEPTWAELKRRYEGRVRFAWKIALMDRSGFTRAKNKAE